MNVRGHHGLVRAAMIRISTINGIHTPLAAGTCVNHLGQHSGGRWGLTEYVQTHYERKFTWPELITLGNGQHGACGGRWGLNVYKHTMKECCSNWELGDIGLI